MKTMFLVAIIGLAALAAVLGVVYITMDKAPPWADEQRQTGCNTFGEGCGGLSSLFAKCCSVFACVNSNLISGGTCR